MATLKQIMLQLYNDMDAGCDAEGEYEVFVAGCPPPPGVDPDAELSEEEEQHYRGFCKLLAGAFKQAMLAHKRAQAAPFN